MRADRRQKSPDFPLEQHDDGDNQVHDESFDDPMGNNKIAPLGDQIKQANDGDADGHLVSFRILDQTEKGVQDDGDKEDIQKISQCEVGKSIEDIMNNIAFLIPCPC